MVRQVRRVVRAGLRRARALVKRLKLTKPGPCAQVTRVVTGWDGVTVTGRLIAVGNTGEATVTMSHQDVHHSLPVVLDGDRFRFVAPVETIATAQVRWRFSVSVGGGPALPIGRHLDDPPRPDKAIRYPARILAVQDDLLIRVRPAYSARGRLLLSCSVPGEAQ